MRYIKGTVAHRVIEYLKDKNYQASLEKLRHEEWKRNHRYSLWRQEKHTSRMVTDLSHIGRRSREIMVT